MIIISFLSLYRFIYVNGIRRLKCLKIKYFRRKISIRIFSFGIKNLIK